MRSGEKERAAVLGADLAELPHHAREAGVDAALLHVVHVRVAGHIKQSAALRSRRRQEELHSSGSCIKSGRTPCGPQTEEEDSVVECRSPVWSILNP